MTIETLIFRLDGVKETGPGKYLSRCPSHDDRSPSLAIKEEGDGRILLHCFAGCETENVLAAIGLTFTDIMPARLGSDHSYKPVRNRISAREVISMLDHESLVVALIGADFLKRESLDEPTWQRLATAVNRINSARAQAAPLQFKKWRSLQQAINKTPDRSEVREST